jgi:hypothetical protein
MLQRRFGRIRRHAIPPPHAVAVNAAAIEDATPISAWQPPSAADSVAWCLQRNDCRSREHAVADLLPVDLPTRGAHRPCCTPAEPPVGA